MGFIGNLFSVVVVFILYIGTAQAVAVGTQLPAPVLQLKSTAIKAAPATLTTQPKSLISQPVVKAPPIAAKPYVSPAVMASICKTTEEACLATVLAGLGNYVGIDNLFPIEDVYQCTEFQIADCVHYRVPDVAMILSSPPAALMGGLIVGDVDYALVCDTDTGWCGWKYYTRFETEERFVMQSEGANDCPMLPIDPLPDEHASPPPAPVCDLVSPDPYFVAIRGELVSMEVAGTSQGCIVPRVAGAYLPSHRNFNRNRDYTVVVADHVIARQECRGSYRVELRNGHVCTVGCYYLSDVAFAGYDGNLSDNNDTACYIGLKQPVCR